MFFWSQQRKRTKTPSIKLPWIMTYMYLKRLYIFLLLGDMFHREMSVRFIVLTSPILLDLLPSSTIIESRVLKSPAILFNCVFLPSVLSIIPSGTWRDLLLARFYHYKLSWYIMIHLSIYHYKLSWYIMIEIINYHYTFIIIKSIMPLIMFFDLKVYFFDLNTASLI